MPFPGTRRAWLISHSYAHGCGNDASRVYPWRHECIPGATLSWRGCRGSWRAPGGWSLQRSRYM